MAAAAAGAPGLEEVLELAAEEALRAVGAARLLRTLTKVGELGPGEERFPSDETYDIEEHPRSRTKATRRCRAPPRPRPTARSSSEIYADHPTQFDPGALLAVLAEDPAS